MGRLRQFTCRAIAQIMLFRLAKPLIHRTDPELAHRATIAALAHLRPGDLPAYDARLAARVGTLTFAHPLLLAAGFDKDARAAHRLGSLGFAGGEVGTLTPLAQAGNPQPRLFRLTEDRAVINRMGFNNDGQPAALHRLALLHGRPGRAPVGVNIGANKDSADRIADYACGVQAMAGVADWLTVNISSPNTPGLRALQDEGQLDALLSAVVEAAKEVDAPPIWLKVAPDLDREGLAGVVRAAVDHGLDAILVGNTTIQRPPLHSADALEGGGLSGVPLGPIARAALIETLAVADGAIPIVAAGGIASAADLWDRLALGASAAQFYSALVYAGPSLPKRIVRDLRAMLDRSGVADVAALIGSRLVPPPVKGD